MDTLWAGNTENTETKTSGPVRLNPWTMKTESVDHERQKNDVSLAETFRVLYFSGSICLPLDSVLQITVNYVLFGFAQPNINYFQFK